MKKFFLTALSAVIVICLNANFAAAQKSNGLLYKISGKNLKKPSYLFGTIHIVCPNDMFSMEKLNGYLDQTERLVMELDMDDPTLAQEMGKGMIIPDGKTLKDFLTAEEYAKVDEMFKNYMGASVENFKQIKPFALAVMISTNPKALGCSPNSYETSLLQSAVAKKKNVEGLETVASQFMVFEKKSVQEQANELYKLAQDPQKSVESFKTLTATYKLQDSEALYKMMSSQTTEAGGKAFMKLLLDDRNALWIPKMEQAMLEKPTFFAVGGGHLGGKNGVINLLKKKGYKIEAVKL